MGPLYLQVLHLQIQSIKDWKYFGAGVVWGGVRLLQMCTMELGLQWLMIASILNTDFLSLQLFSKQYTATTIYTALTLY